MNFKVEQVSEEIEESVRVRCHDPKAEWVNKVQTVLLPIAHCWHFWYSPADAVIYAAFILLGKIVWHMVDFGVSVKTAADINRLIRNRKRKG